MSSDLERTLETRWKQLGGPELVPEFRFHPTRKWRFDRACPDAKIAIELEGGTFSGGRHTRGKGFSEDCAKYNQAALLGWIVIRLTADMLDTDPAGHLEPVIELARRGRAGLQSEWAGFPENSGAGSWDNRALE